MSTTSVLPARLAQARRYHRRTDGQTGTVCRCVECDIYRYTYNILDIYIYRYIECTVWHTTSYLVIAISIHDNRFN